MVTDNVWYVPMHHGGCCCCCLTTGVVHGHLALVSLLVLSGSLVPALALLVSELLEASGDDAGDVTEARLRILIFYLRSDVHRVEEVGAHVALGCVGVLLRLLSLATWLFSWCVVLHLLLVADLVGLGLLGPLLHLLVGHGTVLLRQQAGHIAETGLWVLRLHLGTVCLGIEEEGRHGSLGLVWILYQHGGVFWRRRSDAGNTRCN
mmetsp:Transcript_21998/g.61224  ORF Transcript_21998/g.61224 Transcript_21998/m.61224 type:complete len:206 (+) Transcript_21998:295-912(+)